MHEGEGKNGKTECCETGTERRNVFTSIHSKPLKNRIEVQITYHNWSWRLILRRWTMFCDFPATRGDHRPNRLSLVKIKQREQTHGRRRSRRRHRRRAEQRKRNEQMPSELSDFPLVLVVHCGW